MSVALRRGPRTSRSGRFGTPEATGLAGAILLAVAAALVGFEVTTYALDETLFKLSAVRYGTGLPDSFLHDNAARATSRLYALSLMPVFKAFDGDVAVRVAKGVNAAYWVSTVLPAYGIARQVLKDRPAAALAAVAGVAVPWIGLSTALFSESLAYPVGVWCVWAILNAALRPVWWRDLLVLLAIAVAVGVRVQMVSVLGAYVLVAATACWLTAQGDLREAARVALKRFPALLLVLVVGLLVLLRFKLGGQLDAKSDQLLGDYQFRDRGVLPSRLGLALLVELLLIGLGVGVLPLVLALAWVPAMLRRRAERPEAWWFVVTAGCVTAAIWLFAAVATNGYIGPLTEERYFIYPVPLIWIAAIGALRDREAVQRRTLLAVGGAFALLSTTVSLPRALDAQIVFLAPVSGLVSRGETVVLGWIEDVVGLGGLVSEDLLLVVTGTAAVALYLVWDRPGRRRLGLTLVAPLVVQLGLVVYALTAMTGQTAGGVAARDLGPPAAVRGWLDRALGNQGAQWLDSEPRRDPDQVLGLQRETLFWNDRVGSRLAVKPSPDQVDFSPLDVLPLRGFVPDLATGRVGLRPAATVQWVDSPLVQLVGQPLATSPDGLLELVRPPLPAQLRWVAPGLGVDGRLPVRRPSRLYAYPGAAGERVELELTPPAAAGEPSGAAATLASRVRLRLGDVRRTFRLTPGGAAQTVTATLCPGDGPGTLTVLGASLGADGTRDAGALTRVRVRPGASCG